MSSGSFFRARTCNRDPNRQVSVCGARGEGLLDASERGREEAAVESAAESAMMWKRTRGRRVRRRRVCSVLRRGSRDKNESKARSIPESLVWWCFFSSSRGSWSADFRFSCVCGRKRWMGRNLASWIVQILNGSWMAKKNSRMLAAV
jgi:hypothetical protein